MAIKFTKADSSGDKFNVVRDGMVLGTVSRSSDVVVKRTASGGFSGTKVQRWVFQAADGTRFQSKWKTRQSAAQMLEQAVDAAARGEKPLAR